MVTFIEFVFFVVEYRRNGIHLIDWMVNQLSSKKLDQSTFGLLCNIISHQLDITSKVFHAELSMNRVEVVFEHIKEVPYYLQSDLEINQLPDMKPAKSIDIGTPTNGQWHIVDMEYDLNEQQYNLGA